MTTQQEIIDNLIENAISRRLPFRDAQRRERYTTRIQSYIRRNVPGDAMNDDDIALIIDACASGYAMCLNDINELI